MTGRLRRQPLKISLPNRNRNIIKAAQPQNPTVAYNVPDAVQGAFGGAADGRCPVLYGLFLEAAHRRALL